MTTRIDTVRSEINHAGRLLHELGDQLDDLHVLAYNRHRAQAERVNGGGRDYALDTHGDPKARALIGQVAKDVRRATNTLRSSLGGVRGFLTTGATTTRRDGSADCTTDEVIEALEAQNRRRERGEYEPAPLVKQRLVHSQTEWRTECEALRAAVRKLTADFAADHQHCQAAHTDHRGQRPKLPRRYRMSLLTPRERDAWRRATQSVRNEEARKAS